jgi:small basic protein (TIGR04137 family)
LKWKALEVKHLPASRALSPRARQNGRSLVSIHKSLRLKAALARSRNVFTRWERIEKLKEAGEWSDEKEQSVFGLRKVRTIPKGAKKKKKAAKKKEEGAEGAEGAAAPAEGAAAAPAAAGGKPAAGAAAAKPAAGAAAAKPAKK